jgi:hypothetical protein
LVAAAVCRCAARGDAHLTVTRRVPRRLAGGGGEATQAEEWESLCRELA